MKKVFLTFIITFFAAQGVLAQKIGVVDTNYILSKLPQYKDAESRLNQQIADWQKEIQTLQTQYEEKKQLFENERVLLVGDALKTREKEVKDMEANIKNTINARFGTEGEINRLRASLVKPFQDQIWNAIRTVSEKNTLGIVLDKSNNISVIFLDKKYDYTDKVLDLLIKNTGGTTRGTGTTGGTVGAPVRSSDSAASSRTATPETQVRKRR